MTNAQTDEAIRDARLRMQAADRTYKAIWRANPTAKGFRKVDKALDALHAAEREYDTLLLDALDA